MFSLFTVLLDGSEMVWLFYLRYEGGVALFCYLRLFFEGEMSFEMEWGLCLWGGFLGWKFCVWFFLLITYNLCIWSKEWRL